MSDGTSMAGFPIGGSNPTNLEETIARVQEQHGLPCEVTALDKLKHELVVRNNLVELRASAYNMTLNRFLISEKLKDKVNDLPYIINQTNMLFQWFDKGTLAVEQPTTGNVVVITGAPHRVDKN